MKASSVLPPPEPIASHRPPCVEALSRGPFLVEPNGALVPRRVPTLHFSWHGRPCEARITAGRIHLAAAVGAVPYTAERAADRPAVLAVIKALAADLPVGWQLRVLPNHRLQIETQAGLLAPFTAVRLVTAMVGFVLALDPYLQRLELAGTAAGSVAAGPAMAGTMKT